MTDFAFPPAGIPSVEIAGTPAGVGALQPGDRLQGGNEGLEVLRNTIGHK
jgi:2-keto-4-pentenoate hydratase/2-oxohepta-3-ene-1,7-dioic acid hydratase in catechol pathway